jgi:hypothetical protein
MRCWVLGRNSRFAAAHLNSQGTTDLTHSSSPVSPSGCYRLHSTWCRGRRFRLRWKEHHGWGVPDTGGKTQQFLQTDFPPARLLFQARRREFLITSRVLFVYSTMCDCSLSNLAQPICILLGDYKFEPAAESTSGEWQCGK